MPRSTCWTMIRGAARGEDRSRDEFADRYQQVVRAYLQARWRGRLSVEELEEAVQEVFLECFRQGGLLDRADEIEGGFHAFLYGTVRNVARRVEERRGQRRDGQASSDFDQEQVPADEDSLSAIFDRGWARAVLAEATRAHRESAEEAGGDERRRASLLQLRFGEGLGIADIARRWKTEAKPLYHQYKLACREFEAVLLEVLGRHKPGSREDLRESCRELLGMLR